MIASRRFSVRIAVRGEQNEENLPVERFPIRDLADADWRAATAGVDVVFHLAARVHLMSGRSIDSASAYHRTNTEATLRLARRAALSGVRRFVFLSSIKVNGERTRAGSPFTAEDVPRPEDAYGRSKRAAEEGLRALAAVSSMDVVIVRPVLVYGPGVKANFLRMLEWVARGTPLPLGAIHNRRSLVALDNLVDLLVTSADHPAAGNQTFLVSDGEDMSTTELLRRTSAALSRKSRLIPVPPRIVAMGAALAGKRELAKRLLESLQVDIGKTRRLLGWSPPVSVDEGLRQTAAWLLAREAGRV